MKRRHFIKQSSIAAAGGLLIHQLPLNAGSGIFSAPKRHVVLCVVAGLATQDFEKLFTSQGNQDVLNKGLICAMNYGGAAAGHRLALEAILRGKYIGESQSGQLPLAQLPLFHELRAYDKKYLVTSDRSFLKSPGFADNEIGAIHLQVSCSSQGENALMRGSKANFGLSASVHPHPEIVANLRNEIIERNDSHHRRLLFYSEDLLVAETACAVIRNEQPTLLVAHFMGADVAHGDVSQARTNLQHIGTGIRRIWTTINNHPEMQDNTLLVVLSDFGRNGFHNSLVDKNGNFGTDHSVSDKNTTNTAALFASNVADFQFPAIPKTDLLQSTDIFWMVQQFLGRENHLGLPKKDLLEQA